MSGENENALPGPCTESPPAGSATVRQQTVPSAPMATTSRTPQYGPYEDHGRPEHGCGPYPAYYDSRAD